MHCLNGGRTAPESQPDAPHHRKHHYHCAADTSYGPTSSASAALCGLRLQQGARRTLMVSIERTRRRKAVVMRLALAQPRRKLMIMMAASRRRRRNMTRRKRRTQRWMYLQRRVVQVETKQRACDWR
jgi:hypothetical protein